MARANSHLSKQAHRKKRNEITSEGVATVNSRARWSGTQICYFRPSFKVAPQRQ